MERLKAANGGLTKDIAVKGAQGKANVGLSEAKLDSSLLELFGELFEIITGGRLLFARFFTDEDRDFVFSSVRQHARAQSAKGEILNYARAISKNEKK